MIRPAAAVFLLMLAVPTGAATKRIPSGSFDRVRVEGPFQVTATSGASPAIRIDGEPRAIEGVEVRVDGTTLVVRAATGGWGEQAGGSRATSPASVTISSPALIGASVLGAGKLSLGGRMRGERIDLSVAGAGALSVAAIDATDVNVTVIGGGSVSVAGKARATRLGVNGPGSIDASGLATDDLKARLDGLGEVKATARYTADVSNVGLGRVSVAGKPKCTVRGGGPVSCGVKTVP